MSLPAEWLRGEVAVLGLARSGRAVAELLARGGARVYASDLSGSDEIRSTAAALAEQGIATQAGGHDVERVRRAALLVVSPGVPPDAAALRAGREAGVAVVSELEVALRASPGLRYLAVTGTNGKTTTTAIIAHLLEALGHRAVAAGNIGTPLSAIVQAAAQPDWVALEVSSFQLHDTPSIAPRVGVLTNLSPNHLDRYESVADYYGDKALLFRNSSGESGWVINGDDPAVRDLWARSGVQGRTYSFSLRKGADAALDPGSGELFLLGRHLLWRRAMPLIGDHNVANALAAALAVAAAVPASLEADQLPRLAEGLASFQGLEHRIETVAERDGVLWINDSKSTSVSSTLVALQAMRRPTVLLLGGRHKGAPYTDLIGEVRRTVHRVIAYGEAAPIVARDLEGAVPIERLQSSFEDIVRHARSAARPGDVVLLSPACSSFDMFEDYEHRGREFKRLVRAAGDAIRP